MTQCVTAWWSSGAGSIDMFNEVLVVVAGRHASVDAARSYGHSASARCAHSAIYDPPRDRMVVFGGVDGSRSYNDVWELGWSTPTPVAMIQVEASAQAGSRDSGMDDARCSPPPSGSRCATRLGPGMSARRERLRSSRRATLTHSVTRSSRAGTCTVSSDTDRRGGSVPERADRGHGPAVPHGIRRRDAESIP